VPERHLSSETLRDKPFGQHSLSDKSINNILAVLSKALHYAADVELIRKAPPPPRHDQPLRPGRERGPRVAERDERSELALDDDRRPGGRAVVSNPRRG
jgi:hypothetical protein